MTFLKVSVIGKRGEGDFALRNITFSQRRRQKIAIVGETGSGKSTLLKIIAGLLQPDTGEVFFNHDKVKGPLDTLVPGHPSIGYVSQDFELPKHLNVGQILSYANSLSADKAATIYSVCRIDQLLARKTDALSGGERQRIAIARTLTAAPELILLDEPFSNLDRVHKGILKSVILDLSKTLKISCILISHEPADILPWADRILILKNGELVQQGTPEKIYRQPINAYAAGLFGSYTALDSASEFLFRRGGSIKKSKQLFLRPDNFELVSKRSKGVPGRVKEIHYFGTHYELQVECSDGVVTVRTNSGKKSDGDRVYVSIAQKPGLLSRKPR